MENVVITISRQYGSGGKTIAAMLAQKLGVNFYSRDILKMASEDSGINEELFGMSDEKIRRAGWLRTLSHPYEGKLLPPEDKEFVSDDNLFNYQAKVIKDLAQKESCVIVGRCADYALADYPNTLSVFITASDEERIARLKDLYKVDDAKAKDIMVKTDKKRSSYYNYYSSKRWGDAKSYDLCLSSTALGVDGAVDMILEVAKAKQKWVNR